jgi:hypothetical protein
MHELLKSSYEKGLKITKVDEAILNKEHSELYLKEIIAKGAPNET